MTRDMTRKQFLAALERNGFSRPILLWVHDRKSEERNAEGRIVRSIDRPLTFTSKGKLLRRESLANLLRARDRDAKKEQRK